MTSLNKIDKVNASPSWTDIKTPQKLLITTYIL